jgi:hypothetical protein
MSSRSEPTSRRHLFDTHDADPWKVKRCPICEWAVEQDHAEALAMHTRETPGRSQPTAGLAPEPAADKQLKVVGFALV